MCDSKKECSIYYVDENKMLSNKALGVLLTKELVGLDLKDLPLRTRSKVVKIAVCKALGYDVPKSFKKTKPKFPCQNLDVYTQKSTNLQIWNDEIDLNRRYALLQVSDDDLVTKVRIIDGSELEVLDTTGTLTTKYQARMPQSAPTTTISDDSQALLFAENKNYKKTIITVSPNAHPNDDTFLSISSLYSILKSVVGMTITNTSHIKERTLADEAHELACKVLGYSCFEDDGKFPDIKNQLLEVKLQTSPTIDLGLHKPDDTTPIGVKFNGIDLRVCDTRYLIISAERNVNNVVVINNIFIVSGVHFFDFFTLFQGKIKNSKLQIPLPSNFFD